MTKAQKFVLAIAILASLVVFLDGSVVNVALPAISNDLGGGLSTKQWVVDAYTITLGALILTAGSLSDLYGRRKVLAIGLIGFGVASALCAIAPSALFLIIARALQGVAGALIIPSSLALIISSFSGAAQGKAIGRWTAWTGIAFIVGPLLGGLLVDNGSWRYIFAINIIPIIVTLWLLSLLDQPTERHGRRRVDIVGSVLAMVGLGAPVWSLIEAPHYGFDHVIVWLPLIVGVLGLMAFVWYERRTAQPMLPLDLFSNWNFTVGNIVTTLIYAGLSMATFLIVIFMQQVGHYSAFAAGMALLPITIIMFFLSSRFGELAGKYGPRLFMGIGPIVAGAGFLYLLRVNDTVEYWSQLFPGIMLFGLGLSMTVAPLTSTVLSAISDKQAGVASGVNNAISRIAGLVAIASVGLFTSETLHIDGFKRGAVVMAALLISGGMVSIIGIRNPTKT